MEPLENTDDATATTRGGPEAPVRLRLGEPGALVAAVPHLIGFRPLDSLVLAAVVAARDGVGRELGAVLRADLPAPRDLAPMVGACVRRLGETRPDEVALVVVGGGEPARQGREGTLVPPRAEVVDEAETALAAIGAPVTLRLWTPRVATGETWRCYPPCGCVGAVGRVEDSPMAVASTVLGRVTFGSRTELEASLAPDPGAGTARRRALVVRARVSALLDRGLTDGTRAARRDLEALRHARREVAAGCALGDTEVARLAVALTDPRVRDACLGWALDDDPADVALLWTELVRAAPAPEVADPAALLALTLLARGGGALVGVALQRARHADPGHRLTVLVDSLLEEGVGREEVRSIIVESGRAATDQLWD